MRAIQVGNRLVGPGQPCFVVAEAGVNHDGRVDTALRLVDMAADAGADAVKFQSFTAGRLATPVAPKAAYQLRHTPADESQAEMLRRLELSDEAHVSLLERCRRKGVLFLSTPFDEERADFLDRLQVPLFKIPSGELTNLPFLVHVALKRKPMIVSTGMSTLAEVRTAVEAIRNAGDSGLVLLHCVSSYPAEPRDANLRAMHTLAMEFNVPVGFSDHTPGTEVALAAAALGACVIEKHFTLDRTMPGPDHAASLEPGELAALVAGIRKVEVALGDGRKQPMPAEAETAAAVRRSLVAARDIPPGTRLTSELIAARRPGTGMPPRCAPQIIGRRVRKHLPEGTVLREEDLDPPA